MLIVMYVLKIVLYGSNIQSYCGWNFILSFCYWLAGLDIKQRYDGENRKLQYYFIYYYLLLYCERDWFTSKKCLGLVRLLQD